MIYMRTRNMDAKNHRFQFRIVVCSISMKIHWICKKQNLCSLQFEVLLSIYFSFQEDGKKTEILMSTSGHLSDVLVHWSLTYPKRTLELATTKKKQTQTHRMCFSGREFVITMTVSSCYKATRLPDINQKIVWTKWASLTFIDLLHHAPHWMRCSVIGCCAHFPIVG